MYKSHGKDRRILLKLLKNLAGYRSVDNFVGTSK